MQIREELRKKICDGSIAGFTRKEIEELGITYPPKKGWRKRLRAELTPRKKREKALKKLKAPRNRPSRSIYHTEEWKRVRYQVLKAANGRCMLCGKSAFDGCTLQVDHIKPVWKYPELALSFANLQVLCTDCNWGKGGYDETDWRHQQIGDLDSQWREKIEA